MQEFKDIRKRKAIKDNTHVLRWWCHTYIFSANSFSL